MTIGERIRCRRKELGLSINQLAKGLGKNRATLYRYENNEIENIPTTILEPLSLLLQTTPDVLCGFHKCVEDIKNRDILRIVEASQNMSDKEMELLRKYAEFTFPHAFNILNNKESE